MLPSRHKWQAPINMLSKRECLTNDLRHTTGDGQLMKGRRLPSWGESTHLALLGRKDSLLRVLIVDDHIATADTLRLLVVVWGHDVRYAYDGANGLKLAIAFCPDVLLLDMLMPGMDGFQLIRTIRRQHQLQHSFIVSITGRTDLTHRCQSYEAGADLVLMKPVAPAHMQLILGQKWEHVQRAHHSEASCPSSIVV